MCRSTMLCGVSFFSLTVGGVRGVIGSQAPTTEGNHKQGTGGPTMACLQGALVGPG